jgi:very-short-patch-repair endonuclease
MGNQTLTEGAPQILSLLDYIEQVEKLKAKPAFTVPSEYFTAYQHELAELPELQFNLQADGDDVWLRLPRLREIAPPELDETLKPWVILPKTPEKQPELRGQIELVENKVIVGHRELASHPEVKEYFDWYVEYQWNPWAEAEKPRRKVISQYQKLHSLQQAISTDGAETPLELAWGIGNAIWKRAGASSNIKHPLLVQVCEVTLNENTLDLEVRPRDIAPKLELDCYAALEIPGVPQLEAFWKSFLVTSAQRVNPFEPSSFEGVLTASVGHLDPKGTYRGRDDDGTTPSSSEHLMVTNTWVLFGRKRSSDIFQQDLERLKKAVEAASKLPSVIRSFVEHGDSTVQVQPEVPFRGLSSSESVEGALELYFPMPYNDEQVSIVRKLETNDGVVVQGPPGTGKTHTIANVICHFLAQGKRVLVTAKGESALAVLQEKLPEQIRPLSVALLSDERDGMKQFEHSIQTIASSVSALNPTRAASRIASLEADLSQLHAKIAHVDQAAAAYASKHMAHYSFQGRDVSPEDMAKTVVEQMDQHSWFDDTPPPSEDGALPFTDEDIVALRQARITVGEDLSYWNSHLPENELLPRWADLLGLHSDIVRAKAIETTVTECGLYPLVDSRVDTFERAQRLLTFLQERTALQKALAAVGQSWTSVIAERFADMQESDPVLQALLEVCAAIQQLEAARRDFVPKAIDVPVNAELNPDFQIALARLVEGKSAFSLPFGKGEARKLIAGVTVLSLPPADTATWSEVARVVEWRGEVHRILARWNALAPEFGFDTVDADIGSAFRRIVQLQEPVEHIRALTFDYNAVLFTRLHQVFGQAVAEDMWEGGEPYITAITQSLQAHLDKDRLAYAMKRVIDLLRSLDGYSGDIVDEVHSFLGEALGHTTSDEAMLQTTWLALQAELARLNAMRSAFASISHITSVLIAAGADRWSNRLRTQPAGPSHDLHTPASWLDAWNWRQAVQFLDRIDGHAKLRQLFDERRALTAKLARTYQELVAEKTWLGVFNNSPTSVRQALQAYLNAIHAMGAGTGVRAVRHRKNAREAMLRAYQAVPCWVMPQWRISETIPAEIGLFDLVVIDEASQSDIWALPALLRGKKMLIVGDHKQVSPSAVGTAEAKIQELATRFLRNQPHGSEMTPDKSIYDLARVVFAGNSVMLKEHFRCVPAIIEFSNREFYEGEIRPLRVSKANERLDPPLVDIFVKGGNRRGDVNEPEAKAIVDELKAILADEALEGRSIGIVTLLGTTQAARIHELVHKEISPTDIVARRIAVGPPPVFQGRERDIMLVSMVLGPGDRDTANRADMHQRFNVALSRARDRMYLFRSKSEADMKEDSLNGRVLRHFRQPFRQDARKVEMLRERCESGFELEMFDELVKRGYRVEPQVPCGGYRIDFVVEGAEGRRLAVECDGDRFHGPGQWQDDMARQRVLERAGWTFWRCFASTFVRRREEALADLIKTLNGLGIEPLGTESVDNTIWVQSKEVDPYGVSDLEIEETL